jgi:putative transcriptional regulator
VNITDIILKRGEIAPPAGARRVVGGKAPKAPKSGRPNGTAGPIHPMRRLRLARGITLNQMATDLDWDTGNLSRAERFGCKSIERAAQIAKYFGGEINEMQILYPERYVGEGKL